MDTAERLKRIFNEELGLGADDEAENLSYGNSPEWDSIAHIYLISAIELEFGIEVDGHQISEMTSFARIAAALERHANE